MNEELKQKLLSRIDYCEVIPGDGVEVVEVGDWIDEGKYSYQSTIIKYKDKFYSVNQSRSGSYHTDYYYDDPTVYEVVQKERTTVDWIRV